MRLIGVETRVVIAIASGRDDFIPVAMTDEAQAVDAPLALARAFLTLCGRTGARRMDQLVRSLGAAEIARAAGLAIDHPLYSLPARITEAEDVIGFRDSFIGIAARFGRLDADQLDLLASLAPGALRLTPWRSILLPGANLKVLDALETAGLIVSPDDPRLAIAACPGRPACASAQIDTRFAADALAPFARLWAEKSIAMHISGCSKGCASALPAPVTLVGRDGGFDIVLNGRADAEPVYRGLDLPHVIAAISTGKTSL